MAHDEISQTDRRAFLQASALGTAAAMSLSTGSIAQDAPAKDTTIPTRKLGKTGIEVTLLDQGAVRGSAYDNVLRLSYARGVRVFDTAKVYGTEPNLKKWFEKTPEVRKSIVLITKDMPKRPTQIPKMVDERLKALGTDYLDVFFVHGLGDDHKLEDAVNMVAGKGEIGAEFKAAADAIKKSGKVKAIGFSSHHKDRAQLIQAAAEGGIVDAIMLQYSPWLEKDSPLNKALDAAHKAGIGLISMKQIAAHGFGDAPKGNILEDVMKKAPILKERGLKPFQGLLHAIWSDERISAVCVSMRNTDQVRENTEAARKYEPLKIAEIEQLRDAVLAQGPTLCTDCDGRCSLAAGTTAELGNLTRFLTYHQHLGDRTEARRQFAAMAPEARDWTGADLAAAREACPHGLDFAKLMQDVERHLA
ncbi:MAG: putative oxidoreductase of aldo/keto reductase family [Planctomycetota bacterium]|nr:putative oxidoreductase of aldo/keto reductase family [Planctomycetota bacterium]